VEVAVSYKLLLQSVNAENIADIIEKVRKIFSVGAAQASDIVNAAPVVLLEGIPDLARANRMREKLQPVIDAGATVTVTDEPLEEIARLRWAEPPPVWEEESGESAAQHTGAVLNIAKYDLAMSKRNLFRCPSCGEIFLLKRLSRKEEEAKSFQEQMPETGARIPEQEELDLASFEEGLSALEPGRGVSEPPRSTSAQPVPVGEVREVEDFFEELESLPTEKSQERAPRPMRPGDEPEELTPEEAAKLFERGATGIPRRRKRLRHTIGGDARRASPAERAHPAPETVPQEEQPQGFYGVVISQLATREKKDRAARIIVELTSISYDEARSLCDRMIVNVLREVSQEEAQNACQRFRDAGIAAKVTTQKRKKRRSERER
jgi:ribosomal protein L7/L12